MPERPVPQLSWGAVALDSRGHARLGLPCALWLSGSPDFHVLNAQQRPFDGDAGEE